MPRFRLLLAATALAASSPALHAQRVDSLVVGARVRVEVRDGAPPVVIGRLEQRAPDGALVVRPEDAEVTRTIDAARVRALAVSTERLDAGAASRRGALRGFLFGGAITLAATALTAGIEFNSGGDSMRGLGTMLVGGAGLALTGITTAVGAVAGRQDRDRWVAVPVR